MQKDLDLQKANVLTSPEQDHSILVPQSGPSHGRKCLPDKREDRPSATSHLRASHDTRHRGLSAETKRALAMISSSDVQRVLPGQSRGLGQGYRRTTEPIHLNRGFRSRILRRLNQLRLEIQLVPLRIRYIARHTRLGSWFSSFSAFDNTTEPQK